MDYTRINYSILDVLRYCNIKSFPLDCQDILNQYNIEVYSYSSLSEELYQFCMKYSNDALKYRDKICYNDSLPLGRIRFSLMHELGHIVLDHGENQSPQMEQEANYFASNILAPRIAIHYAKCKDGNDVAKLFSLTSEAAQYAFDDYIRWYERTNHYKMSLYDKAMYRHFYNSEIRRFVFSIQRCAYCDSLIYNSKHIICDDCYKPYVSNTYFQQPDDANFARPV